MNSNILNLPVNSILNLTSFTRTPAVFSFCGGTGLSGALAGIAIPVSRRS